MYQANEPDLAPTFFNNQPQINPPDRVQRKITSVRRPSDAFIIWDGPQVQDQNYNAYELASATDKFGLYSTTGLCFGVHNPSVKYGRPIWPGQFAPTSGQGNGRAAQVKFNIDMRTAFTPGSDAWATHYRFRHMKNTRLAALCVDGHVETREAGTVMDRDIFTNYK
jgi:hypothetical protein